MTKSVKSDNDNVRGTAPQWPSPSHPGILMPDAQPGQPYSWQIPNNGPLDVMPTGSRPMPLLLTYTTPDGHQQAPSFTGGVYVYPEGLTLDSAGHFSGTIAVKVQESYYEFKVLAHNSAGIAISPFRFILKVTA